MHTAIETPALGDFDLVIKTVVITKIISIVSARSCVRHREILRRVRYFPVLKEFTVHLRAV